MVRKHEHPAHDVQLKKLNRVSGQVDGIKKMVIERRYCPEILMQLRAVRAAIKSIEANIMTAHLHHCVQSAMEEGDSKNISAKLDEINRIFSKYSE